MKRFILIDGSNMLFRAYYAVPAHFSTSTGQPTNAVFGFVTMLNKLLNRKVPDFGAVVFDPPGGSFRKRESEDYKSNRARMPEDLASQLPLIDRAVEAFQFPVLRITDFEADDVIATLAKEAEAAGHEVLIVSSDKDFSQLLTENVSMLDGMKDVTYTPELVRKKFGVSPEKFVDFQALCGDKIDNIPGVAGIGKKTASKLLDEWESLDGILENLEAIGGSAAKKIGEHREDALMSRRLARLRQDVEHGVAWESFVYSDPNQDSLNELFNELEFYSLLKAGSEQIEAEAQAATDVAQVSTPKDLQKFLTAERLAFSLLFDGAGPNSEFVAASLTVVGESDVASLSILPSQNAEWSEFFANFQGTLVTHDAQDLYRWCQLSSIEPPARVFDTRTAHYVLDPSKGMPHDLVKVAKIRLQIVLPKLEDSLGKGKSQKTWAEVDLNTQSAYISAWVRAVSALDVALVPLLEEADIDTILADEVRLSKVLVDMELTGIAVDRAGLESLSTEFREKLAGLEAKIFELAGREFNVGSPKQLSEVLFEDLSLPVIKKTKTGYSTNAEVLEKLAVDHEIARELLEYRKFEKLISTYVDVLLREVNAKTGDRVHCRFGQTVSTTGRLSTSEPDLQRTPVRTEEGKRIRRLFKAGPGHQLVVADWSQIELRVLTHLCHDPVLVKAFSENADIHKRTASELFGKPEEEITKDQRDTAKTVNFATIYGQGSSALGQNLGIPKKEAKAIIAKYFEVYAGVREWIDDTMERALVTGTVETIAGRSRFIPELFSKNFAVKQAGERMAVNTPVQGSAADICKAVMIRIADFFSSRPDLKSKMLLQIHDELVFECPDSEVEEVKAKVTELMENAWELTVPLLVSVGVGPSWEEAKE